MTAYALYNEIDPFAAAWLEQLIARGHIAPGVVDRRSIEDISPDDLRGFRQVHFFAGIGVWSYALRRTGVPDDANVWTGSCPCQPFSAAGKGGGVDDERHLWPHFHHLIRECRPDLVFGEQVASKDGLAWLDLVQADMEATVYAFGALDTCAAGFGAPHIRQRLYWFSERLADSARVDSGTGFRHSRSAGQRWDILVDGSCVERLDHHHHQGLEGQRSGFSTATGHREGALRSTAASGEFGGLADSESSWNRGQSRGVPRATKTSKGTMAGQGYGDAAGTDSATSRLADGHDDEQRQRGDTGSSLLEGLWVEPRGRGVDSGLEYANGGYAVAEREQSVGQQRLLAENGSFMRKGDFRSWAEPLGNMGWTGPTNGFWADADWLHCRDERWRPVEPFTFPLAHGAAARVGRLRGYGNAINAEQATGFLEAFFEAKAIEVAAIHETTRDLDARSLTAELIGDLL